MLNADVKGLVSVIKMNDMYGTEVYTHCESKLGTWSGHNLLKLWWDICI